MKAPRRELLLYLSAVYLLGVRRRDMNRWLGQHASRARTSHSTTGRLSTSWQCKSKKQRVDVYSLYLSTPSHHQPAFARSSSAFVNFPKFGDPNPVTGSHPSVVSKPSVLERVQPATRLHEPALLPPWVISFSPDVRPYSHGLRKPNVGRPFEAS